MDVIRRVEQRDKRWMFSPFSPPFAFCVSFSLPPSLFFPCFFSLSPARTKLDDYTASLSCRTNHISEGGEMEINRPLAGEIAQREREKHERDDEEFMVGR